MHSRSKRSQRLYGESYLLALLPRRRIRMKNAMTRTEKLARWYRKCSPLARILMQGAGSFVIFYGGSILEQVAQDDFKTQA